MIPDVDQLDATLANRTASTMAIGFRGVSQQFGDETTSVPNASGRWINLRPFELEEVGHGSCVGSGSGTRAKSESIADRAQQVLMMVEHL